MQFLHLQPFVPSGKDFEQSKQFFLALGFRLNWEDNGYAGLEKDGCRFILQRFDNRAFAENFMLTIAVDDVAAFREKVLADELPKRFGIRVGMITQQAYGREVNIIDIAGVCWHFVES